MTPLAFHPDKTQTITNDVQIQAFLVEHGIFDQLFNQRRPPGNTGGWSARINYARHPTHWVIVYRNEGLSAPERNGYTLQSIPKTKCSAEKFRAILAIAAAAQFPEGADKISSSKVRPPQN